MENKKNYTSPYDLDGKIPFGQALALGLQHVLAMFVGNLTPILLITGPLYCDLEHGIQIAIIQNAMVPGLCSIWSYAPLILSFVNPDNCPVAIL